MIQYPLLQEDATIGVTAPSSGVPAELHHLIKAAIKRMELQGHQVICGDTVWSQHKAKSSTAGLRAAELNNMMQDERIHLIIPPWGGELLIEILEYLDFDHFNSKWILGYSDISLLLLACTLNTGIATAHGTNLVDLRGESTDLTTAMWKPVLSTAAGESVSQYSSEKYQKEWLHNEPSSCIFHLTEPTCWKVVGSREVNLQGRLLGGCIDVIRHLIGTPFGNVELFQKNYINSEPLIWYLENCELSATDLRRSLIQMKLAGWFRHCSGILFGRSPANQPVEDYTAVDVYTELHQELQVPIIYDVDCGHMPPQITFINGAYAEIEVSGSKGAVKQIFRP